MYVIQVYKDRCTKLTCTDKHIFLIYIYLYCKYLCPGISPGFLPTSLACSLHKNLPFCSDPFLWTVTVSWDVRGGRGIHTPLNDSRIPLYIIFDRVPGFWRYAQASVREERNKRLFLQPDRSHQGWRSRDWQLEHPWIPPDPISTYFLLLPGAQPLSACACVVSLGLVLELPVEPGGFSQLLIVTDELSTADAKS